MSKTIALILASALPALAAAPQFDESRMTPPQFLSGPSPKYDERAIEHGIEGTMSVRCTVTKQGAVHDCHVVKGLPFLDAAVVRALEQRKYTPATVGGQPIEVDYTFDVRMRLP